MIDGVAKMAPFDIVVEQPEAELQGNDYGLPDVLAPAQVAPNAEPQP